MNRETWSPRPLSPINTVACTRVRRCDAGIEGPSRRQTSQGPADPESGSNSKSFLDRFYVVDQGGNLVSNFFLDRLRSLNCILVLKSPGRHVTDEVGGKTFTAVDRVVNHLARKLATV